MEKKTVPEVLSTARRRRSRAVLKTKGTVFSHTDRLSPVNNTVYFFSCSKLVLQSTNGFVYAALVIQWSCAPSTNDLLKIFATNE